MLCLIYVTDSQIFYIAFASIQVTLHSQVKATLSVHDAWLDLQDGFVHNCQNDGRPASALFPLTVSPASKASMLFSICFGSMNIGGNMILYLILIVMPDLLIVALLIMNLDN